MTNEELLFICNAVQKVSLNYEEWQKEYQYNPCTNEFDNLVKGETIGEDVKLWFSI